MTVLSVNREGLRAKSIHFPLPKQPAQPRLEIFPYYHFVKPINYPEAKPETKPTKKVNSAKVFKGIDITLKTMDFTTKAGQTVSKAAKYSTVGEAFGAGRTGVKIVTSISALAQGKLSLRPPRLAELTTMKVRDLAKNVLGVVTLIGGPAILIEKAIKWIHPSLLETVGGKGLGKFAGFFEKHAIFRIFQFLKVATFVASIEVFIRLAIKDDVQAKDLVVQAVEVLIAGAELTLIILKIVGVASGAFFYIEVAIVTVSVGLFIYGTVTNHKPENSLKKPTPLPAQPALAA